jgi:hypothetical protein
MWSATVARAARAKALADEPVNQIFPLGARPLQSHHIIPQQIVQDVVHRRAENQRVVCFTEIHLNVP